MLTVLKEAEDGKDVVLRLVEIEGRGGEAQLSLPFMDRSFSVSLAPYEIKTLRMEGKKGRRLRETNILEE
jgi:alpha-mannosidase